MPVHIVTREGRKLLAISRNLWPASVVQDNFRPTIPMEPDVDPDESETPVVPPEIPVDIEECPYIDIYEPILLEPNRVIRVPFYYKHGIPRATEFDLSWYIYREDRDVEFVDRANRVDDPKRMTIHIPRHFFSPFVPLFREDNGRQEALLKLVTPNEFHPDLINKKMHGALSLLIPLEEN